MATRLKERQQYFYDVLQEAGAMVRIPGELPTTGWPGLPQPPEGGALPVTYLGQMPMFRGYRVYPGHGRDWVLVALDDDPLFDPANGGYPVPSDVLRRLSSLLERGFDPAIYAAHEVEVNAVREGEPETLRAVIPRPSAVLRRDSSEWGTQGSRLWSLAAAPLKLGRFFVADVAAAGAAVFGLGLDPILLGALPIADVGKAEAQAAWFFLSAWRYDDEP